jgi:methionyl-tRNA formyltransferase
MAEQAYKNKLVIATIKSWNLNLARRFREQHPDYDILIIEKKEEFNYESLKNFNPKYVFLPHWSWIISKQIYENFECIVFHMTDLPFGRGGSPLQNLIERGIKQTKISAIRVVEEVDAGPVYIKYPLSLEGAATGIYQRASEIIFEKMIPDIIKNKPAPVPQQGEIVVFKRRTPQQSDISDLDSLEKVYDYIRMLNAEDYPPAFLEKNLLRIEFSNAEITGDSITALAKLRIKK